MKPIARDSRASYARATGGCTSSRARRCAQPSTGLQRYIATPDITKHRLFVWLPAETLPDSALIVFARDDDYTFGVLHSRAHELWARGTGTQLREVEPASLHADHDLRDVPVPAQPLRRGESTKLKPPPRELDDLREGWLNPPGHPTGENCARARSRTSTTALRPGCDSHERLDRAVLAAYGWPYPLDDGEVLERLLGLNLASRGQSRNQAKRRGLRVVSCRSST